MVRSLMLVLFLASAVAFPARASDRVETVGDYLQYILPVTGAICSFGKSALGDYAIRFAANMGIVHGSKNALADASINIRPHGGDKGFPSGHTAAAFYGASYLARECVNKSPWGQATVFGAAMFTGGSRIEAGAHFLFQVMFGALVGFGSDRLFRKKGDDNRPQRWHVWRDKWAARASKQSV